MKRIALFLLIAAVAVSTADAQKVKRTKKKEAWANNFEWYLLEQKGKGKGVAIDKDREIIPLSEGYQDIEYRYKDLFIARKNNCAALYDSRGNNIIPLTRGYASIKNIYHEGNIYFEVCRPDHKTGLCDRNGREILPCRFITVQIDFGDNPSDHLITADSKRVFYYDGEEVVLPVEYNNIKAYPNVGFVVYKKDYSTIKAGFYDIQKNEIISFNRWYTDIELGFDDNGKDHRFLRVYNNGDKKQKSSLRGICQLDGKTIIEPQDLVIPQDAGALQYEIRYNDKDGFYYNDKYDIKHYLGVKLNSRNQAVPYSFHPFGTTDRPVPEEQPEEHTAYNNSTTTTTTTYNNSTSTYQPVNSYNTYTPPTQHKQQSSGTKNKTSSTTQPKSTSSSSSSSGTSTNKSSSSTHKSSPHKNNASSFQSGPVKCANCSGTGMARCWSCSGKGTIRKSGIDKNGKQVFRNERCTGCNGSGKRKCTVCNGKGVR